MKAIEQNKNFTNEFALFLMPVAVAGFWDRFLDNTAALPDFYNDLHDIANARTELKRYLAQPIGCEGNLNGNLGIEV